MKEKLNGSPKPSVSNFTKSDRFYIHVINIRNGRRRKYSAAKEEKAVALAKKHSDTNHHAHVYDMEERDDTKRKPIYTTAPKQKETT